MGPIFQVEIYLHCSHSASKHIYSFGKRVQQFQGKLMNSYSVWWPLLILTSFSVHKLSYCKVTAEIRKVVFLTVFVKTKQTFNLLI